MIRRRLGYSLWLFAMMALYFFENNTGTRILLTAAVLIPLISLLCAAARARRLRPRLRLPEGITAGEKLTGCCETPGSLLRCFTRGEITVSAANIMTGEAAELKLALNSADFSMTVRHCGMIRVSLEKCMVTDWFGLAAFDCGSGNAVEVMARPCLWEARITYEPRTGVQDTVQSHLRGTAPQETMGLREYVPGDDIRRIHWKLSARGDQTYVRETGRPEEEMPLLVLELGARQPAAPEAIDRCVTMLLSAARAMLEMGMPCQVCHGAREEGFMLTTVEEEADLEQCMERLLRLPMDQVGYGLCGQAPIPGSAHTVVFSPSGAVHVLPLYHGYPITLVTAEEGAAGMGSSEIRCVSPEDGVLELEI